MKILNIHSSNAYPSNVLSNFYKKPFVFRDIQINSIEGFIQGLREADPEKQKEIFLLDGFEAKRSGIFRKIKRGLLYWQGSPMYRESSYYLDLLARAYVSCFMQNEEFRSAIRDSKDYQLTHSIGKDCTKITMLTEAEFINILTRLRNLL